MTKVLNLLMLFTFSLVITTQAQDQTLFGGPNKLKITGAFGGFAYGYTSDFLYDSNIRNSFFGLEISNNFDIVLKRVQYDTGLYYETVSNDLDIASRGLEFVYRPMEQRVIHPYMSILVSRGKIRDDHFDVKDKVGVFQPRLGFEINALKFFKLNLNVGYNHVDGVDLTGFSGEDFSGGFGEISFKFGGFWN